MNPLKTSTTTQNVAVGVAGSGLLSVGTIQLLRQIVPQYIPWEPDLDEAVVALFTAVVTPFLARFIAFQRDPMKAAISRSKGKRLVPCIACMLCASMMLQGCATTLPAVGGRTHYNVEFSDITTEQATNYKMQVKAPAGTELQGITGMTYDWDPNGPGRIAVSTEGSADTTEQSAMIQEVSRQQVEAFRAGLDAALNALAPILGQYIGARVREGELKADVSKHAIDTFGGR